MYVFRTIEAIRNYLKKEADKSIGFTPTMGALHEGHLSLLHKSKEETDISVVSIFVNPTQFNDPADLAKYPRTLEKDLELLHEAGCDVVFVPEVEEMYPPDLPAEKIDLNGLDLSMEGYFRPGHFAGVAQVVKRLLDIVEPHSLYMGQKDFQQVAVVSYMIQSKDIPVKLVMCPTMREPSGLAMSSRNVRLSPEMREQASVIYKTLKECKEQLNDLRTHPARRHRLGPAATLTPSLPAERTHPLTPSLPAERTHPLTPSLPVERGNRFGFFEELQRQCMEMLTFDGFKAEYFEIIDGHTLHPATKDTEYIVACCAVWAGDVRLIDNMIIKQSA